MLVKIDFMSILAFGCASDGLRVAALRDKSGSVSLRLGACMLGLAGG